MVQVNLEGVGSLWPESCPNYSVIIYIRVYTYILTNKLHIHLKRNYGFNDT